MQEGSSDLGTAVSVSLVFVTVVYAYLTFRIAKASEKAASAAGEAAKAAQTQAEAAELSIAELREQRLATARPFVVIERAIPIWRGGTLTGLRVSLRNAGTGVALYLRVSAGTAANLHDGVAELEGAIQPLQLASIEVPMSDDTGADRNGVAVDVTILCHDIFGRGFATRQQIEPVVDEGSAPARLSMPVVTEVSGEEP
ncbi:MAG: hypothetical protein GY720_01930 [bacterium]|nr:hypothetical protein [bacterium]